jgi:hypothetical protein
VKSLALLATKLLRPAAADSDTLIHGHQHFVVSHEPMKQADFSGVGSLQARGEMLGLVSVQDTLCGRP